MGGGLTTFALYQTSIVVRTALHATVYITFKCETPLRYTVDMLYTGTESVNYKYCKANN